MFVISIANGVGYLSGGTVEPKDARLPLCDIVIHLAGVGGGFEKIKNMARTKRMSIGQPVEVESRK